MSASDEERFEVVLERQEDFVFTVDFGQEDGGDGPTLQLDEPPPLGEGRGPNATRLLAAAVGNCLAASLLYCMGRGEVEPSSVRATVRGRLTRNNRNRLRVEELQVRLDVDTDRVDSKRVQRCLDVFEDYCVVTESVRKGIDVLVEVNPGPGRAEEEEELTAGAA